jgi:hypothetical protein
MERASAGQPVLPLPGLDVVDPPEQPKDDVSDFDKLLVGLFDEPRGGGNAKQN